MTTWLGILTSRSANGSRPSVISWLRWTASNTPTRAPFVPAGAVKSSTCTPACKPYSPSNSPTSRSKINKPHSQAGVGCCGETHTGASYGSSLSIPVARATSTICTRLFSPSLVKIGGMFIKITWEWCHPEEERADAFGASASDKTAGDTEPDAQQLKRVARI